MPIHRRDLPELLRNAPTGTVRSDSYLHTISDVTEQVSISLRVRRGFYAFPWPDSIEGFGAHRAGPFERCERCGSGTWVKYGTAALCLTCATGARRG
jgi:hypothetical protein